MGYNKDISHFTGKIHHMKTLLELSGQIRKSPNKSRKVETYPDKSKGV